MTRLMKIQAQPQEPDLLPWRLLPRALERIEIATWLGVGSFYYYRCNSIILFSFI